MLGTSKRLKFPGQLSKPDIQQDHKTKPPQIKERHSNKPTQDQKRNFPTADYNEII